jgi:hypothetical protein
MSSDHEQEHFTDGISEDIITDLSKLSELLSDSMCRTGASGAETWAAGAGSV